MFGIFGTPNEVKITCKEIESEISESLAAPIIKQEAIKLAKDKSKTGYSIKKEGLSPKVLAHILITNSIQALIISGQFHVYRGTLNAVGQSMVECWDYSVNQMQKLGRYSHEEAENDKKWLRDEIQKIG